MSYGEVEENVMTRWLYRYEAKKIQDYVLGTSRLKEIAGASALVEQLGDDFKEALTKAGVTDAKVITCAAGQATVIFADEASLRRLASVWPMYCARTRPGLPVIQGWVEFPEGEPDAAGYAELMRALFAKLDADRMSPRTSLPEVGPLVARAGRSGLAALEYAEKDRALCDEAMRAKLAEARKVEARTRESLLEGTTFAGRRFAHGGEEDRSFDEGYVAIVHADGNNIGKRFQETPFHNQERLSNGLSEATREAVKRALRHVSVQPRRHAAWNASRALLPFRPVVLGGDDVTVMLRADDALPFTYEFLRAFQAETASRLERLLPKEFKGGLTASAGVAMVKSAFPYHAAYDLAAELCQHAKSEAKRHAQTPDGHPTPAALVFHRVTTASLRPWRDILNAELNSEDTVGALAGGPWTLGDTGPRSLTKLHELAGYLYARAVPRGTLREWVAVAQHDRKRAKDIWQRMLDVLADDPFDGRETRAKLEATLRALGAGPRDGWREDGTTPVGDALAWMALDPHVALDGAGGAA